MRDIHVQENHIRAMTADCFDHFKAVEAVSNDFKTLVLKAGISQALATNRICVYDENSCLSTTIAKVGSGPGGHHWIRENAHSLIESHRF